MERRLPIAPLQGFLRFPSCTIFHIVHKYELPKTGIVFCFLLSFFLACKQQGGDAAYLQTLQKQHDTYLQQFQQTADALQQQSAQIKASIGATGDTTLVQKVAVFDKKLGIYRERYTISLDKYQQLIKRFEASAINRADMAGNETNYMADFKTYEDAFKQMAAYLNELPVNGATQAPK